MRSGSKILIIRSDRLGDVMMTLPTLEYLRGALPGVEIDFLCSVNYRDLLQPYLNSRKINWVSDIKEVYQGALLLNAEKEHWWQVAKNRIRTRVGIYSKPLSFLLLNSGLRQHRSRSLQNEALYNLDLAKLFIQRLRISAVNFQLPKIVLPGDEATKNQAWQVIKQAGITGPFILFHPGMGGSALNISPDQYLGLMENYEKQGTSILLSVGPLTRDGEMKERILSKRPNLSWFTGVSLSVLREVFRAANLVVAPSTGPLHLAHFVGTATVGIYPPVRSQHPDRWAPWGGGG